MPVNWQFQTPMKVARLMVSLIEHPPRLVLEPSIGEGNLVKALWERYPDCKVIGYDIHDTPLQDDRLHFHRGNFLESAVTEPVDFVLTNPPFTPMVQSYQFLEKCVSLQPRGVYLMPYLFLINSTGRAANYRQRFDLRSVYNLPRTTFQNSRIQCCLMDIYPGQTAISQYHWWSPGLWPEGGHPHV